MDDSSTGDNPLSSDSMTQSDQIEDAVFLDPSDAVEVQVDEENVPMDEEDDDDVNTSNNTQSTAVVSEDMSKIQWKAHSGQVYAIAAHVDPTTKSLIVLSGGGDDRAYLHAFSEESKCLSHSHTDSVSCVAFNTKYVGEDLSKTPKLAAVGAYDGAIVLYDMKGDKVTQLEGPSDVECMAFHPKGGTVLLVGSVADGTVWMYHLPTSKCLQVFVGHESGVAACSFTKDGRWALSASSDGTLRVWAPKTGMAKHVFRFEQGKGLTCMAVGGGTDGHLVIVGAESGMAHVCHPGAKKVVASLRHYEVPASTMQQDDGDDEMVQLPMSVEAVGFALSNPNWCATGGVDGVLKIWDLTNDGGQCRQVCPPPGDSAGITRLQWHPTLPLVLTCCADGAVRLWDARNGTLVKTMTGHGDIINDMGVDFFENGGTAIVCTGSDDKTVRVFEIDIAAALQAVGL